LEALLTLLKENKIPVVKAGIGNINKTDIISAKANVEINELDAIVAGFNVEIKDDANKLSKEEKIQNTYCYSSIYYCIDYFCFF